MRGSALRTVVLASVAAVVLGASLAAQTSTPITAVTADGVTVYGEPYLAGLGSDAPLVLLFHQGGANGRGEYAGIARWLNSEGFRAIAWDQRRGGSRLGSSNRTVAGLAEGPPESYCDAYADLEAALDYVTAHGLAERVIAWGSSYSGALVFRLAAEHPTAVRGVIAFSPASGDPMAGCEGRQWVSTIRAPMLVLRPGSEMALPGPIEQRRLLIDSGVVFRVVDEGVHGSSMLVDDRTGSDMSGARGLVMEWLRRTALLDYLVGSN